MASAKEGLAFLVQLGLLDVVLPFVLVFTVIYALLQRTKVLGVEKGRPKAKLNALVAFVLGFTSIVSLQQFEVLQLISQISGVALVVVLALLMIAAMIGVKDPSKSKLLLGAGVLIAIVGFLIVLHRLGVLPERLSEMASPEFGVVFIVLVLFLFITWFIMRAPEAKPVEKKKKKLASVHEPRKIKEFGEKELEKPGFIFR